MAIMRWTPWNELESVNRQLSQLLDTPKSGLTDQNVQWAPSVDIRETDDALLVQADLPGVEKKNIKLEIKDAVLSIAGERHYEKEANEANVHRVERSYGSFMRSFSLPSNIDADKVEADMKDGVLAVRLPKRESAKPKAIQIS